MLFLTVSVQQTVMNMGLSVSVPPGAPDVLFVGRRLGGGHPDAHAENGHVVCWVLRAGGVTSVAETTRAVPEWRWRRGQQ
ncbi:hypothetical protein Misp04_05690 [Micromonospora sp. NBRC 101691]|nr:hypothetical protein Misp04_05690 [Micromonospora sp. NBRC 101691]